MVIEYNPPKRKQPFYRFVKGIMKLFMKKKRVVVLGEELGDRCLYLGNHANKMGPVGYDVFLPVDTVKWGAYQMLGNYGERRAYLRDVLYIRKNGLGKARAAFKAFFEAYFSKFFYKGMKFLPTYPDMRLIKTVRKSVDVLNDNTALLIFPENSDNGYKDEATDFFSGFVLVMENYAKRNGADVPIRPVYLHKRKNIIVVGESTTLSQLTAQGLDRNGIAEYMKTKVNELYRRIESGEFDKKKKARTQKLSTGE